MSFWTEDLLTKDVGLHALAGAGLSLPLVPAAMVWWPTAPIVVALWMLWGLLREQSYSRGKHRDDPSYQPWLDWWTVHKALEGVSWGPGAGVVLGIAAAF